MAPHFLDELRATFERRTRHVAIQHHSDSLTYGDLSRLAANGAAFLRSKGMEKGGRVVLFTPAKVPFLIAYLSVLYGGGIPLPLNPRFTREEMRHFLHDSGACLAIAGPQEIALLESLRPESTMLKEILVDEQVTQAPFAKPHELVIESEDGCLLMYSSGTTGWPKGVLHTNANLACSLRALQECWRITSDDIVVNVLPLFHIHGLSFASLLTLLAGGCLIIEDSFQPAQTMNAIERGTVFMAVPTIYYRFLEDPSFPERTRSWRRVRLFTCGSAPIRADVLPRLEEILQKPVINRYGMTEAHVISSLPLHGPWPAGSVGLPLRGIDLRILDANRQPAKAGEVGSVFVRGENLFREYWSNPEATRKAFATGWFDTGDLGHLDERGFLTLAGRSNDLIITSGYNVYPQVVERLVNACPGVADSAVVGVKDEVRGERVVVFVVRDDASLDEARLSAFLSERLIDYQRPRQVFFVEELPRNALGKVLRKDLVKLAEQTA